MNSLKFLASAACKFCVSYGLLYAGMSTLISTSSAGSLTVFTAFCRNESSLPDKSPQLSSSFFFASSISSRKDEDALSILSDKSTVVSASFFSAFGAVSVTVFSFTNSSAENTGSSGAFSVSCAPGLSYVSDSSDSSSSS